MAINGVNIKQEQNYVVCYIDTFSDELKDLIRAELNYICHGRNIVDEDTLSYYSYQRTLKDFLGRYNKKETNTKKGMMGEFIAHLVINKALVNLQAVSIFFNKEEASIKKGFDLTYIDTDGTAIWYGEVKSGEPNSVTAPDNKNKQLLGMAKKSIKKNLSGQRRSLWDNVIGDAALTFASEKRIKVQDLLKRDIQGIETGTAIKKNAILVSVLFHDVQNKINPESIEKYLLKITSQQIFSDVVLFSIQKSTYSKIEEFLRNEISV